jgi:nicotinate-nucleotide pyrophosphorylase (carboxylating)
MALDQTSRTLIELALAEDIGPGDITSALIPSETQGQATLLAKQDLVLAGCAAFDEVYRQLDPSVIIEWSVPEGTFVKTGTDVGSIRGAARSLLTGERTALNLLQRLCGVASMAHAATQAVSGTNAKIVDTRKTTPGIRALQKSAVRAGGAFNHRFGLFDGVLIKDNHIGAMGGVKAAIESARRVAHHLVKIELEIKSLDQLEPAIEAGADVVMLDNMDLATMRDAVQRTGGRVLLEASGGVTLDTVAAIAATGVDFISMGALTHSAAAADISLNWDA